MHVSSYSSLTHAVVHTHLTWASGSHGSLHGRILLPTNLSTSCCNKSPQSIHDCTHNHNNCIHAVSCPQSLNLGPGWVCSRWSPQRERVREARHIKSFTADTSTLPSSGLVLPGQLQLSGRRLAIAGKANSAKPVSHAMLFPVMPHCDGVLSLGS